MDWNINEPYPWPALNLLCREKNSPERINAEDYFNTWIKYVTGYVQPFHLAVGEMVSGDLEKATKFLEEGAERGDPLVEFIHLWPLLDPLRRLQHFQDLLLRLQFPKPPVNAI